MFVIIAVPMFFGLLAAAMDYEPTKSSTATLLMTQATMYPLRGWALWLVWNHVVVREFPLDRLSFLSAFFIAWGINFVTASVADNNAGEQQ
jgi:hypothetical protein